MSELSIHIMSGHIYILGIKYLFLSAKQTYKSSSDVR